MNELIKKVKLITIGFNVGYNDTLGDYYEENFDYFHRYFNDSDEETRKHAFFLFMYLLGNVYAGHVGVLPRQFGETHKNPNTRYVFEQYLQAFLQHEQQLQKDFPIIYHYAIYYMSNIEETLGATYETHYSDIPKELFQALRTEVLAPNEQMKEMKQLPQMKYLLHEMNIEPFFPTDVLA